ncbi:MAG: methylated-DNA--[protein]-cysteine S-methyltransferase [bacterium]
MLANYQQSALDYQRIEAALGYLEQHFQRQPSLREIAESIHVSEYHFQRLFSRWVGISPKRFLQFLTKEYAKRLLQESQNLLEVTFETGLSSPGRLHELFVTCEAVTPGEFKLQGEGLTIEYGFQATPFGTCLLAVTERGICALIFSRSNDGEQDLESLKKKWEKARLRENTLKTQQLIGHIFTPLNQRKSAPLHLLLKGTNFQIKVWEALLRIPVGRVVTYEQVAAQIGRPKAVRAVANAIAHNPVPYIIPCHRVIRKIGEFGGYQGGTARKKALLGWEAAKCQLETS